jgi:hypothetical protein
MINAGIEIGGFDGNQQWVEADGVWAGITVTVNYPNDQVVSKNPITVGDVLIEPSGNVWDVVAASVVDAASRTFRLNLRLRNGEPTEDIGPGMGMVKRAGIVTPKKGFVAPHWDTTLVSSEVSRIASMVTMDNAETDVSGSAWAGVVDLGELP